MSGLLGELDLTKQIGDKSEYRDKVHELQLSLLHFQRKILESRRNVILVFEGPDAAGKGGVIKRITEKLDPRLVRVYSTVKPTEDEYRHHYLWRFWTKMPAQGAYFVHVLVNMSSADSTCSFQRLRLRQSSALIFQCL